MITLKLKNKVKTKIKLNCKIKVNNKVKANPKLKVKKKEIKINFYKTHTKKIKTRLV